MDALRPLTLSPQVLFLIYLVPVVLVLACLIDFAFFESTMRTLLPATPFALLWFAVLFNVPHHVASLFSFADRGYLSFYRSKLVWGLPLLLIGYGVLLWYSPEAAFIVFILYTEYHVMSQHAGIARLLSRVPAIAARLWKWLGILMFVIAYGIVIASPFRDFLASFNAYVLMPYLVAVFIGLSAWLALRSSQPRSIAAISLGIIASVVLLYLGYPFLAIFAARFLHDAGAFAFYISHDYNRNREERPNALYRAFGFTKLPVYILTPVLAIGIAYLLQSVPAASAALIFLYLAHYYVEGFAWKREGLHRKQLQLA